MIKILLIEDEDTCREIAVAALSRLGISDVVVAQDGKKGLKLLDRMDQAPDIVITDILMPNQDGIEIVSALVTRKFAGGLILLSGAEPMLLRMATLMAADGGLNVLATLIKPLDSMALTYALERFGKCNEARTN